MAAPSNEFGRTFGPIYLAALAVLWGSALPECFGATDGITADGTPVGNLAYATASFIVAAFAVHVSKPPSLGRNDVTHRRSDSFMSCLPCEWIYVVSARDGDLCDVLKQFAQAAIPRIGA